MKSDGSELKRLTNSPGYDGGPFFSPDGNQICWRRFSEKGDTAEIFTMNIESGEERQLTSIGALSWAPYFHPSSEYLIFATNKHGFGNFELYLVDSAGKKDPWSNPDKIYLINPFVGAPINPWPRPPYRHLADAAYNQ